MIVKFSQLPEDVTLRKIGGYLIIAEKFKVKALTPGYPVKNGCKSSGGKIYFRKK